MPKKETNEYDTLVSDETGIDYSMEEETLNDDSEIYKLQLVDSIRKVLLCDYQKLDKQMSRLSKKDCYAMTLMEATDDIIQVPFYRPFTENMRVLLISLHGKGRDEHLQLVKSIVSPEPYNDMGYEPEKLGWKGRIKRFINKDWS